MMPRSAVKLLAVTLLMEAAYRSKHGNQPISGTVEEVLTEFAGQLCDAMMEAFEEVAGITPESRVDISAIIAKAKRPV